MMASKGLGLRPGRAPAGHGALGAALIMRCKELEPALPSLGNPGPELGPEASSSPPLARAKRAGPRAL
jgi:hypothetical protein